MAPRVQAALDAALQDEEDITLDAKYACCFFCAAVFLCYFVRPGFIRGLS